jgi:hypothetical protein
MTQKLESTQRLEHVQEGEPLGRHEVRGPEFPSPSSLRRRAFLGQISGMTVATLATGDVGVTMVSSTNGPLAHAAEMVELYWQALTRDVPFAAYATHPLINAAAADLSRLSAFRGPQAGDRVTPATLFRGSTPGDLIGPYLSQFLWLDVPSGVMTLVQRGRVPIAGDDYMTTYPEWLNIQRGLPPTRTNVLDTAPRYLRNGRDLGTYVHRDFTYQAFLNAGLILLAMRAPLQANNPYTRSRTQSGFVTFGAPHVLDLVGRVANAALKAT